MSGHKPIAVVQHVMYVLKLIGSSPRGLTLTQAARGTGMSRQTLYNMLGTLVQGGFVVKDLPGKRYRLGPPMEGLRKSQNTWNRQVLLRAVPAAIQLSRECHADTYIYQYTGGRVIARLRGFKEPDATPTHWYHYPVAEHGTGVLLEAFMTEDERSLFRTQYPFSAADTEYWCTYSLLDELLEIIRRTGYVAFLRGGTFRTVAVVCDPSGRALAGLSVVKQYEEMVQGEADRCVRAVRKAAKGLSEQIRLASTHDHS